MGASVAKTRGFMRLGVILLRVMEVMNPGVNIGGRSSFLVNCGRMASFAFG